MIWDTGWSKETVNCNFSLTDLKDTKYSITQWFLESLHREVLIFWCLKRVRWKKILPFRVVLKWWVGLVLTWSRPYWAHIYTLIHPQSAPTSQNITQIHPNTTPDTLRQHQTPADTKRHRQTSSKIHDNPQTILKHSSDTPQKLWRTLWCPKNCRIVWEMSNGCQKCGGVVWGCI